MGPKNLLLYCYKVLTGWPSPRTTLPTTRLTRSTATASRSRRSSSTTAPRAWTPSSCATRSTARSTLRSPASPTKLDATKWLGVYGLSCLWSVRSLHHVYLLGCRDVSLSLASCAACYPLPCGSLPLRVLGGRGCNFYCSL